MRAKEYIRHLLSIENYSFSLEEAVRHTDGQASSIKFELARLIVKKEILNLRKGFYLIIPPRYSKQGQLPIQLYLEKLFLHLERQYYLGFYSAARFHGANHQSAQKEYVMIERPKMNDISKNNVVINFFTSATWPKGNISEKRSDAGTFRISSPALTVVDLIHFQTKLGGLNRMLAIIEELTEELTESDITELLTWYPHKSTLQRFGFLLEEFESDEELYRPILAYLTGEGIFPVLLSPRSTQKAGAVNNVWKVDVNIKLESDL
jgi:predicted transcriptional regulator of viral defense system